VVSIVRVGFKIVGYVILSATGKIIGILVLLGCKGTIFLFASDFYGLEGIYPFLMGG